MEILTEEDLDKLVQKADESGIAKFIDLEREEKQKVYDEILEKMDNPVEMQKHLLTKIAIFLDEQITTELNTIGKLSNNTRIWTKDSFDMLDKLQHNIHGTKSVNVNVDANTISHGQIAQKLRQIKKQNDKKQ